MIVLHTARGVFDKSFDKDELSWSKYIEWSKLTHLSELVSLDNILNELQFKPDYDNADDWNFIYVHEETITDLFTTLDYVLKKVDRAKRFNLLAIVVEPDRDCKNIGMEGYEFVGYDLLDQYFSISALSNCGGFDETFLPHELNDKGLIGDYEKAYDIKKRLFENNPGEDHADTNVIAVWRHRSIGR
jgi:hypothetical protein